MKTSKFKITEIGEIPADWEVKRIDQCGDIVTGATPPREIPELWGGSFYWISAKDFKSKYIFSSEEKVTEAGKRYCRVLPENSVLVTCIASIGLNAIAKRQCATNQQINAVVCRECHYEYFYYQCCFNESRLRQMAGQTAVPIIGKRQFEEFSIAMPKEVNEQKAIAKALSDVDALIAAQEELIEKKRAIKQGAMQELLTGKKRLPGFGGKSLRSLRPLRDKKSPTENAEIAEFKQTELGEIPVDWEVKRIGEIFELSAAGDLQFECSSREKTDLNIYPIYSNSIENAGLYGFTSNPRYSADSITITGRGTLGHAEYRAVDFDAIIRLIIMKPLRMVDGRYVTFQINYCSPFHFEITSIPQLTVPQVANSLIPVPPLPEQKKIAEVLSDMDAEIESLEAKRAKYESIKQGMMQELLTGKTRLKG